MIYLMKRHEVVVQSHAQFKSAAREIRKIRAIVWFWRTCALAGKRSGYAIETYVEPFSKRKCVEKESGFERTITNNKWPRYARGICPHFSLIERTEEDVPGSRAVFEHRIWDELERISATRRSGLMDWPEANRPWLLSAILHSTQRPFSFGKVSALARRVRRSLGGPETLDVLADVVRALGASRRSPVVVDSILLDRLLAVAVLTLCADRKWNEAALALFQYLTASVFCLHNNWVFGDDVGGYVTGVYDPIESSGRSRGPTSLKSLFDELAAQRLTTLEVAYIQSEANA